MIEVVACVGLAIALMAEGYGAALVLQGWKSNKPGFLQFLSFFTTLAFYILAINVIVS